MFSVRTVAVSVLPTAQADDADFPPGPDPVLPDGGGQEPGPDFCDPPTCPADTCLGDTCPDPTCFEGTCAFHSCHHNTCADFTADPPPPPPTCEAESLEACCPQDSCGVDTCELPFSCEEDSCGGSCAAASCGDCTEGFTECGGCTDGETGCGDCTFADTDCDGTFCDGCTVQESDCGNTFCGNTECQENSAEECNDTTPCSGTLPIVIAPPGTTDELAAAHRELEEMRAGGTR